MSEGSVGKKFQKIVVQNAMVINGRGSPAYGPVDIVIEGDTITEIVQVDSVSLNRYPPDWKRPEGDHTIDASGMYVTPGLVDMHAHIPVDKDKCGPRDSEYAYKLWLAHGVTTVRTCGFNTDETLLKHRRLSEENKIVAPRLVVLASWPRSDKLTPEQAREQVRKFKEMGADGIKFLPGPIVDPEAFYAMGEEVRNLDMKAGVAAHLAQYSEIDAEIASKALGEYLTIEHTYGIPQAAIPGSQSFPPDYNYLDELERFRWSGRIWKEADQYPENVIGVLDLLIENGTVWNPTMVIYESNCDVERIQTKKWHQKYSLPTLLDHWKPTPGHHASHHFDWRTSDEIAWKEKFKIWMKYLKIFHDCGGIVTVGSDAGTGYGLYGFSTIRELELLQETGFHPIDVIKMATTNATNNMGLKRLEGGVNVGYAADLAIIDGNPIENFKVMYGTGLQRYSADRTKVEHAGGVRWTIKDGVVFDAKALLKDVEDYVQEMKAE